MITVTTNYERLLLTLLIVVLLTLSLVYLPRLTTLLSEMTQQPAKQSERFKPTL